MALPVGLFIGDLLGEPNFDGIFWNFFIINLCGACYIDKVICIVLEIYIQNIIHNHYTITILLLQLAPQQLYHYYNDHITYSFF